MPRRGTIKLTKRAVERLPVGQHSDRELRGFVCRVMASGSRRFELRFRTAAGVSRRVLLGHFPPTPPEEARVTAEEILRRVRRGEDPVALAREARKVATLGELFARFLDEHGPRLKPSTAATYKGHFEQHIEPVFGPRQVPTITPDDIARFLGALSKTHPVGVNRVRATLSVLFTFAQRLGLRQDNPVRFAPKAREKGRSRLLTPSEIGRLGKALAKAADNPEIHPASLDVLRLLILSACRKMEIASLSWAEVDLENSMLHLADTKTGRRNVPLSPAAARILRARERQGAKVFMRTSDALGRVWYQSTLERDWRVIRTAAGLEDCTIHDLRHLAASTAASLGLAPSAIQRALGHADLATTAKYVHAREEEARSVVNAIADSLDIVLAGGAAVESVERGAG